MPNIRTTISLTMSDNILANCIAYTGICDAIFNRPKAPLCRLTVASLRRCAHPLGRIRGIKRGFAGGRNVAERSERMRAERSPTSASRIILNQPQISSPIIDFGHPVIKAGLGLSQNARSVGCAVICCLGFPSLYTFTLCRTPGGRGAEC